MDKPTYKLGALTPEGGKSLTLELQAVLEKYGCEMGVKAHIEILKRIPLTSEEMKDPILSPYNENTDGNENKTEENSDSETEKSSEGDSGEPTQG